LIAIRQNQPRSARLAPSGTDVVRPARQPGDAGEDKTAEQPRLWNVTEEPFEFGPRPSGVDEVKPTRKRFSGQAFV